MPSRTSRVSCPALSCSIAWQSGRQDAPMTSMKLRSGTPIWLRRPKPRALRRARLRGEQTADVVIVGGGLIGAAIAWTFANASYRTVVLEAAEVGRGSTAANSALLMQE